MHLYKVVLAHHAPVRVYTISGRYLIGKKKKKINRLVIYMYIYIQQCIRSVTSGIFLLTGQVLVL